MGIPNPESVAATIPASTTPTEGQTVNPNIVNPAESSTVTPPEGQTQAAADNTTAVTPQQTAQVEGQDQPPATVEDALQIIEKQRAELAINKQSRESQEKLQQTQQQAVQNKEVLNKQYSQEKLNTYNKYIPFLTDTNAVNAQTEQDFLNALPPGMAHQLGKELAGIDNKFDSEFKKIEAPAEQLKEESVKTSNEFFIKEFEKVNAKDLAIPVVKEMCDLVVKDLTASGQVINPQVMSEYKDNIKKIHDEGFKAGQLASANQAQTGRMQSNIGGNGGGATGKVFTADNPPSLEEMKDLKIFEANESIIMQATARGYYNKK